MKNDKTYEYFDTLYVIDEKLDEYEEKLAQCSQLIETMRGVTEKLQTLVADYNEDEHNPVVDSIRSLIKQHAAAIDVYNRQAEKMKYQYTCLKKVKDELKDDRTKFIVENLLEAMSVVNAECESIEKRKADVEKTVAAIEEQIDEKKEA